MKTSAFQWMAFSFFGYYCAYAVFVPFFPAWLKSHAYTEETIGLIIASSYLFRFIGGLLFSSLIHRASHLLNALRYLAWGGMVLVIIMGLVVENIWLLFLALAIFSMLNAAGMPISDTLASTWQRQIHLDYGKTRLIGSMAFALSVTLFGYIIGWWGEDKTLWILTALYIAYALVQMRTPSPLPQDETESAVKNQVSFSQLLRNSNTLRLFIGVSLIQGSHAAYYTYSVIYWTSQGISLSTTSILWGLGVLAEILLFFFSSRLFKHWTVSHLLYFSAFAAVIRWLTLSAAESIMLIALTQLMHSLTYAMGHYAMVRYITTQPQSHMAKLQGLYNGLSSCAAIAILTALAGFIYPISASITFIAMAICAGLALLFIPRKVEAFFVKAI
ncbi:3-phenylpropionate MFS transporter [Conservatibacter flavescens]|uniref:3-phenylpropionate MFS transporter n=1 Tax=Conservatibacter flavescens TaxID=28161 RepID=A0A2M8S269_9PAST|nr:3-phenylpropionate MFS transporter [Conservatibacter flavescens]PJG85243.1 3-phenylpropionate MFS transporter [Conservatibacter flavescens]